MSLSGALVKFGVLAGPGDTYVLLASVLQDASFIDCSVRVNEGVEACAAPKWCLVTNFLLPKPSSQRRQGSARDQPQSHPWCQSPTTAITGADAGRRPLATIRYHKTSAAKLLARGRRRGAER